MHPTSRLLLLLLLVVAPAILLLSMGPLGWLVLVTIVAVAAVVSLGRGPPEDASPAVVNCSACGAPNDLEAATCGHCGQTL